MDIDNEEFKVREDSKINSEEDITSFDDFENFYGLADDCDEDGELKELDF